MAAVQAVKRERRAAPFYDAVARALRLVAAHRAQRDPNAYGESEAATFWESLAGAGSVAREVFAQRDELLYAGYHAGEAEVPDAERARVVSLLEGKAKPVAVEGAV